MGIVIESLFRGHYHESHLLFNVKHLYWLSDNSVSLLREITTWLSLFLDKQDAVPNYSFVWCREGVFVMGLFLLLVVMTTSFYNRHLKSSSMGKVIKPIQKQYLFYTLLPASLYKVTRLSCLGIRMDHLLFN